MSRDMEKEFENEEFLLYRLSAVGRRISALCAEQYLAEFGLSTAEWRLLAQVGRFGEITATDVSHKTSMDRVAISRAANKCLAQGLIRETESPHDRRVKTLSFTTAGKAFYREFLPRACELANQIESCLSPTESATLKKLLKKLDDHLPGLKAEPGTSKNVA